MEVVRYGLAGLGLSWAWALILALSWIAPAPVAAEPGPERPNMVFFFIDTFRADRAGCYGHDRDTTPSLDGLARRGTLFETAIAQASWSVPSYVTLLTSLYPPSHGVMWVDSVLGPGPETLGETLGRYGYETAAFVGGGMLSPHYGLHRGFEHYWSTGGGEAIERPGSLQQTVPKALAWLDDGPLQDGPFFMFVHGYDLHDPYVPPGPFAEMYDPDYDGVVHVPGFLNSNIIEDVVGGALDVGLLARRWLMTTDRPDPARPLLGPSGLPYQLPAWRMPMEQPDVEHLRAHYDGALTYADVWLGLFLEGLEERGLTEETVIVVAGDHGEELGEHGRFGHGDTMYDVKVRVPLVMAGPGIDRGRRVESLAGLIDLAPTILELAGIPADQRHQGRSLLPHASGQEDAEPKRVVYSACAGRFSVRTRSWHLVGHHLPTGERRSQLFDLRNDPLEMRDVSAQQGRMMSIMESFYRDWMEAHPSREMGVIYLPGKIRAALKDFGYW